MYKPQLVWARYENTKNNYLFLHCGEKEDKTVAILSKRIPNNAAEIIKAACSEGMFDSPIVFLEWIKKTYPVIYNSAYREFSTKQLKIVSTFDLPGRD
jgi:hypothetical protein